MHKLCISCVTIFLCFDWVRHKPGCTATGKARLLQNMKRLKTKPILRCTLWYMIKSSRKNVPHTGVDFNIACIASGRVTHLVWYNNIKIYLGYLSIFLNKYITNRAMPIPNKIALLFNPQLTLAKVSKQ